MVDGVAEFPLVKVLNLHVSISGVKALRLPTFGGERPPKMKVCDDNAVKVEANISNDVSVVGSVENISGALEDVQKT